MKTLIKTSLLTVLIIILTGCKSEEIQKISRLPKELKEVDVFIIGLDKPILNVTLTGKAESANYTYISSEISGRITDIKVEIGQNVKKGDQLISLGDSLSTSILDSNYQYAQNNQLITQKSLNLTEQNSLKTAEFTKLQADSAYDNYRNTLKNIEFSEDFFKNQYEISSLDLDTLEKTYKTSKASYKDAQDNLEDAEQSYEDYLENETENPELKQQLKTNIKLAESQLDNAKLAMQANKNRIEQAELGIQNLEENYDSQNENLMFAAQTAYNQFIAAVNQSESAEIGSNLQKLQSQAQILQANQNLNSLSINKSGKIIKAPLEGKITELSAQKGTLINPGQTLIKIENNKILKIKTELNYEELKLIRPNMAVTIELSGQNIQGSINNINTVANEQSKKFEITIIANNDKEIPLESFAKIHLEPQILSKIFIPINSVYISDENAYVYIMDKENKIQIQDIDTGMMIGNYIEVKSGLNSKDKVILKDTQTLEVEEQVKQKAKPIKRKP